MSAAHRCRIRNYFRDHAWAVRVPRGLQETTLHVQRASAEPSQTLGHHATPAGLAQHLDLPRTRLEFVELSNGVQGALGRLPEREQQILLLRFYGERTQSQVAERLGISQVHVSRVLTRNLTALRDHVLDDAPLPKSWEFDVVPAVGIPSARQASSADIPPWIQLRVIW